MASDLAVSYPKQATVPRATAMLPLERLSALHTRPTTGQLEQTHWRL